MKNLALMFLFLGALASFTANAYVITCSQDGGFITARLETEPKKWSVFPYGEISFSDSGTGSHNWSVKIDGRVCTKQHTGEKPNILIMSCPSYRQDGYKRYSTIYSTCSDGKGYCGSDPYKGGYYFTVKRTLEINPIYGKFEDVIIFEMAEGQSFRYKFKVSDCRNE